MHQRRQSTAGFTSATSHKVVAYPGTAKIKRKRRPRVAPLGQRLLAYILCSVLIIWVLRGILLPPAARRHYRIEAHVAEHVKLYEKIFKEKTNDNAVDKRQFQHLGPTYGVGVSACDLTVLFMDPRIADPKYSSSGPAWFALESLAAYAPKEETTCVMLATHYCAMQKHLYEQATNGVEITEYAAKEAVRDWIYSKSLPLFRKLIQQGRVRVSFVDFEKYQLKWCDDFGDPTPAFLHIDFWTEEFIKDIDSDLVLVMQEDAVLCQELDIWHLQKHAYVGAVWPREATDLYPFPEQGMCRAMPGYWRSWLGPQRKWRRTKDAALKPAELLQETFPSPCEYGEGPVGNGGLSIRQRSWMQTVIATCPHERYSGMDLESEALACKVLDQVSEDLYFSVVLRGLDAPLPTAAEAALFSSETLYVEDVVDMYGERHGSDVGELIKDKVKRVHFNGKMLTLPVGLHKPWWYLPSDLLLEMTKTCPYLKYIYDPKEARYEVTMEEHSKTKRITGRIGT